MNPLMQSSLYRMGMNQGGMMNPNQGMGMMNPMAMGMNPMGMGMMQPMWDDDDSYDSGREHSRRRRRRRRERRMMRHSYYAGKYATKGMQMPFAPWGMDRSY